MKENGLRAPAFAALSLAFASFGDAFLYPFLPVNHAAAGVPVVWIGVLLSINRMVRIFSNGFMVHLLAKYGLRMVMITAAIMAILSTLGYAVASGVALWLLFRVCWGLSFSAMRIGTLGYALRHERPGIALGVSRGLQEAGPMVALFIAPMLLNQLNINTIFILLAVFSLPGLFFAFKLPRGHDKTPAVRSRPFLKFPSTFDSITLVSAILIDGIVVVVLGVLFLQKGENITLLMATTWAAFYLGYRRVCLVVLSPAGGWIADRFSLDKVFTASAALVIVGLIFLVSGWVSVGAIIVFTFYSIHVAVTPGSVSKGQSHVLAAVAENATWRDIGAALGTLLGGFLIASSYLAHTLLFAIFGLLILLLIHLGTARKELKYL